MKIQNYFILLLSLSSIAVNAQSIDQFITALGRTDYQTIESFLDNKIDLCVRDQQRFVSKEEAMNTIRNFYTNHPPKSIEPIHQGSSRQASQSYKLAKLTTGNGIYRVFIYFEDDKNKILIKELRFELF